VISALDTLCSALTKSKYTGDKMKTLVLRSSTGNNTDIAHLLRSLAEQMDCGSIPDQVVLDEGFDEKTMSVEVRQVKKCLFDTTNFHPTKKPSYKLETKEKK